MIDPDTARTACELLADAVATLAATAADRAADARTFGAADELTCLGGDIAALAVAMAVLERRAGPPD